MDLSIKSLNTLTDSKKAILLLTISLETLLTKLNKIQKCEHSQLWSMDWCGERPFGHRASHHIFGKHNSNEKRNTTNMGIYKKLVKLITVLVFFKCICVKINVFLKPSVGKTFSIFIV